MGQCSSCGQWNSIEETAVGPAERPRKSGANLAVRTLAEVKTEQTGRLRSGIAEWDRVLGGGIVPGSVVLVGGDPGVGKSTLLMQVADAITSGDGGWGVLYISGEESLPQLGLRATRLGLGLADVGFSAETDVNTIVESIRAKPPQLVIVDSIQSICDASLETAPGSVVQLRECTLRLHQVAKEQNSAVLLIGHVTKEGVIAGPKMVEHMVDVVLYLEGERFHAYRLLRGVKNRFGATNEVGVFQMGHDGLAEVLNPSSAFLADRVEGGSGSAIVVTMEGTRPILAEIQALVTRSALAVPRRMASGIDTNRVLLLAAVLSKRNGVPFHDYDIHVNVVGGLRIEETAADLGTALAMVSSYRDVALGSDTVVIGEVGLAGELRSVGQMDQRLREAAKLGFRRAVVARRPQGMTAAISDIEVTEVASLREAVQHLRIQ